MIAAVERVCDLAERASPAIAVVRSSQPEGVQHALPFVRSGEKIVKVDEDTDPGSYPSLLPNSLKKVAAELAKADGVSLEQFISAAVAERIGSLRAPVPPLVAVARRAGPVTVNPHKDNPESSVGWSDSRYWRWPAVTPPKVRRSEIIKRRAAKFPWIEQTDS